MRIAVASLLVLAACGGGDQPAADASIAVDANPDPVFATAAGTIAVLESVRRSEEGETTDGRVFAHISESSAPSFHTETMRVGSCRLLEFTAGFCDPFCPGVCLADGVCEEFPSYGAAGPITLDGLSQAITLTADEPYNFYNPTAFPIDDDLFAPDDAITASASGATIPAFSVGATGVASLVPSFDGENVTMEAGSDFSITWTPSGGPGRVRLTMNSTNDSHGLPYNAIIECDGPDAGSFTVPQEMVEAFPTSFGAVSCVSIDCPPSWLRRYTRGTTLAGTTQIELIVASEVSFGVLHGAN